MNLPKSFTTVTTFSKGLALLMYFVFPIAGFYLGSFYQRSITPQMRMVLPPLKKIAESPHDLIERCGKLPREAMEDYGHYSVVKGPVWSPDCRHVAWSVWMSGTGGPDMQTDTHTDTSSEGVYLYTDATAKVEHIYKPSSGGQTPELLGWVDRKSLTYMTAKDEVVTYRLKSDPTYQTE